MKKKRCMIIRLIILIIGIVMLLWFLLPVVSTRSINYGMVTGTVISLLLIAYGIGFNRINTVIRELWNRPLGKAAEIAVMVIVFGILILAAATSAAMIKGASSKAEKGATVIVLGARLYDNSPSRTMQIRCEAAYEYLIENPDSKCIVSGGQGNDEKRSEASAMYEILVDKGIDPSRIYLEDQSGDTDENMRFSKEIIEAENLNPVIAIATNDYHEYRAVSYAEAAGLDAGVIPAKTIWWIWPTSVVREMYGILEMWLLKK